MGAVVLTFVVSVVNLALGYALAVRLGWGPPNFLDVWELVLAGPPGQSSNGIEAPLPETQAPDPVEDTVAMSLEQMLDEPADESSDDPFLNGSNQTDEQLVEISVLKLNDAMVRNGAKASEIEDRLRVVAGLADAETVAGCVNELLENSREYLYEQGNAIQAFHERLGAIGELPDLIDRIEMDNLEQTAQVETMIGRLQAIDCDLEPEAARRQIIELLVNLRATRHKVRDDREKAFLEIARHEQRLGRIASGLHEDPLTGLPRRIGLEAKLWQWWKEGRFRGGSFSAVLLDLDQFDKVNDKHGALAGDGILARLAEFLEEETSEADLVGRFAGQEFLIVFDQVSPEEAATRAERIRQTIEGITFLQNGEAIHVTVTAAVTEVCQNDTPENLFDRLEGSLAQANRSGPNRSIFHDGRSGSFMEPRELEVEHREVALA